MKKYFRLLAILLALSSCSAIYLPIVHANKYYEPLSNAVFVDTAPEGSIYIGTVKTVPHDNSIPYGDNREKAKAVMLEAAAKAGARYVVITNITQISSDYRSTIDYDYGDGISLIGEMYR